MENHGRRSAGYADEGSSDRYRSPSRVDPASRPGQSRERVPGVSFLGALTWTASGTIIPGIGLLRAGKRVAGVLALTCLVAVVGAAVYFGLNGQTALRLVTSVRVIQLAAVALVVLGAAWAALSVATYWCLAPRRLRAPSRVVAGLVVTFFTFSVTCPLLIGAQYAVSSAQVIGSIFVGADEIKSVTAPTFAPGDDGDPWANKDRLNVLLLGFDRGIGRTEPGGLTDTIMVASIDTWTGNTVLVSLPRETANMPFPADSPLSDRFPYGWSNGFDGRDSYYFLNSMYTNLPYGVEPDIIGPTNNLGADAVKLSVGEALGLKIDYYVLVNIDGATQLVDAIGGITVNINKDVPRGDPDYGLPDFEPGPNQHLNGEDALLYARSRKWDDDFQRAGRQRCVMKAVLDQADPATLLTRYEAIAAAGAEMVRTDVPATMIPALFELLLRVKNQGTVNGMGFVDGQYGFWQSDPDFDRMADRVAEAIEQSVATAPDPAEPTTPGAADPTGVLDATGADPTPGSDVSQTPQPSLSDSQNLEDFCAYHPE
ncbi:MAG: LCP family protein [Propionibacteriaceae bacterium]|jgi:LCP family protein required for cell wall assembly|nr:LCP family protein [Propionibacteriaceae bacterium]